jgi:hypothetical protein
VVYDINTDHILLTLTKKINMKSIINGTLFYTKTVIYDILFGHITVRKKA